jgi:hypothetical protein
VIVVLWRAGLRISEALALNDTDLDRDRGALARQAILGALRAMRPSFSGIPLLRLSHLWQLSGRFRHLDTDGHVCLKLT